MFQGFKVSSPKRDIALRCVFETLKLCNLETCSSQPCTLKPCLTRLLAQCLADIWNYEKIPLPAPGL
jgi:hypothetical protein